VNAEELMAKAIQSASSAKVLLDTGDVDGACDRAYYAMFNAARAALLVSDAPVQPGIGKTHSGLISAFSLHLVKTEQVPVEYGRTFNRMEELRLIADYKGDPIEREQAVWAVEQAREFIRTMQARFMPAMHNIRSKS
jgi:uncharacterized protein (UPF0332 family)